MLGGYDEKAAVYNPVKEPSPDTVCPHLNDVGFLAPTLSSEKLMLVAGDSQSVELCYVWQLSCDSLTLLM